MQTKKIYLVRYSRRDWEDYYDVTVFATQDESKAKAYVVKFNRLLEKWKAYYDENWQDLPNDGSLLYERIYQVNMCDYCEIELR